MNANNLKNHLLGLGAVNSTNSHANMNSSQTINSPTANASLASFYEQMLLQRNLASLQQHQHQQRLIQSQQKLLSSPYNLQKQQLQLQIQASLGASNGGLGYNFNFGGGNNVSSSSTLSLSSSSLSSSKSQQVSPNESSVSPPVNNSNNDSGLNTENEYEHSPPVTVGHQHLHHQIHNHNQLSAAHMQAEYRNYINYAAAAAAAANSFPYSLFGMPHSQMPLHRHEPKGAAPQAPTALSSPALSPETLSFMNNPAQRQFLMENFPGLFAAAAAAVASNSQHSPIDHRFQRPNSINNVSSPISDHSNFRAANKQEEPKPAHSYIGLIALAILSSPEKKLVLSDIYQWILDNYSYFRTRGSGWRNSIRHNLSLNDCFMKSGRSANGKGHYWTIHPANLEDFSRGDFRRRRAQRRVRKSLGLTVPEEDEEDEDEDEILTPPSSLSPILPKSYLPNNVSSNSSCSSSTSVSATSLNEPNQLNSRNQSLNDSFILSGTKRHASIAQDYHLDKNKISKMDANDDVFTAATHLAHAYQVSQAASRGIVKSDEENYYRPEKCLPHNAGCYDDSEENATKLSDQDPNENESTDNEPMVFKSRREAAGEIHSIAGYKKRSFDVDALLAPDLSTKRAKTVHTPSIDAPSSPKTISEHNEDSNESKSECDLKTTEENAAGSQVGFEDEIDPRSDPKQTEEQSDEPEAAAWPSGEPSRDTEKAGENEACSAASISSKRHSQEEEEDDDERPRSKRLSTSAKHAKHHSAANVAHSSEQNSPFSKQESDNIDVEKWKQTFSKIMARSYKNNNNNSSTQSGHNHRNHNHHTQTPHQANKK